MTFDDLSDKIFNIDLNSGGLAEFDLFEQAREFFSLADIQEKMLKMNRYRLYDTSTDSNGNKLPLYADKTAKHKKKVELPSVRYTYYETSKTHNSLEVIPQDEMVGIYLGDDAPDYAYELDGLAWGLTDDEVDEVVGEDMKDFVVEKLKAYIYG